MGDFEKCIEASRSALKIKPDYALAYNNICSAYNALKQYDKAMEACQNAIRIMPDFQLAKNNLKLAVDELNKQKNR
jgi:tetratricopeptide (TPR) repeat protein